MGRSSFSASATLDQARRLTDLLHEDVVAPTDDLAEYAWTRDALGRVVAQHVEWDPITPSVPDESLEYTYDPTGQLTEVDDTVGTTQDQSFGYDPTGNRVETVTAGVTNDDYDTGAYNRIESDGTWTYEYDAEGNITSKTDTSTSTTWTYTWDHRNRLVKSVETVDSTSTTYVNWYDAFDRWVVDGIDTDDDGDVDVGEGFVYDGTRIILSLDGTTGIVTHRYLWGPGEGQLLCDEQVTSLSTAGTRYWPLADHKGTVRDVLDDTSTIVTHYDYSAFGAITGRYDADSQNPVDVAFRYNGQHYNEHTSQINAWHRWYDPEIGRWLSEDWIKDDHQNTYRYVRNDPVNYIDPTGLEVIVDPETRQRWYRSRRVMARELGDGKHFYFVRTPDGHFTSTASREMEVHYDDPEDVPERFRQDQSIQQGFQDMLVRDGIITNDQRLKGITIRTQCSLWDDAHLRKLTPTEVWALRGGPGGDLVDVDPRFEKLLEFLSPADIRGIQNDLLTNKPIDEILWSHGKAAAVGVAGAAVGGVGGAAATKLLGKVGRLKKALSALRKTLNKSDLDEAARKKVAGELDDVMRQLDDAESLLKTKLDDLDECPSLKNTPKVKGQQFEEITEAQDLAKKRRPRTRGPDANSDWEGAKRPKQSTIHSKQKSKDKDLTDADGDVNEY